MTILYTFIYIIVDKYNILTPHCVRVYCVLRKIYKECANRTEVRENIYFP